MTAPMTRLREGAERRVRDRLPVRRRLHEEGALALTFDDGPDPTYTPQVLDVLAAHAAPATFFLVGRRARRHPELVRRMLADGHAVGSHTWSHPDGSEVAWPALLGELHRGRRAVEAVAGRRVRAFRPPHGYFGGRVGSAAMLAGVRTWLWSADPLDWRPGVTAEQIVGDLGPLEGGDIVLLHDAIEQPTAPEAADRSATVAALPAIIAAARGRGLRLRRLDDAA